MRQSIELASGLLSCVLGVVGLAFAVFGPISRYESVTSAVSGDLTIRTAVTASGSTTLVQQGVEPITMVFLAVVLLLVLGVAVGAYLHSQRGVGSGLILLWTSAGLLVIAVILSAFSIGSLLVPAALLALIAAAAGSRTA